MFSPISYLDKTQARYTSALTSYDLLKALALLLMFVDHVGYFFYPDESWFRIIGRFSVPIWFFLIGYAGTRKVQGTIWLGAIVLAFSNYITGEYLLPLNILFMLAISRIYIDALMVSSLKSYEAFAGLFFLLFFLTLPTIFMFEYGTMGMMFAAYGYLRAHKDILKIHSLAYFGFLFAIALFYCVMSGVFIASVNYAQMYTLFGGMALLMLVLYLFKPKNFEKISEKVGVLFAPIKLMGRHTLLLYVTHLIFLRLIMIGQGDPRFGFFEFKIMPPEMLKLMQGLIG